MFSFYFANAPPNSGKKNTAAPSKKNSNTLTAAIVKATRV